VINCNFVPFGVTYETIGTILRRVLLYVEKILL